MSNEEKAELRYRETMDAIGLWLRGQKKEGTVPAEALGIAKAFLTHAALAIVAASSPGSATFSEANETDAERLGMEFFRTALRFVEERRDKFG
jgi:hypothetical protein